MRAKRAMINMRAQLKNVAPNLYSYLAAARKSARLIGTIRGREIDVDLLRDVIEKVQGLSPKTCPICSYYGNFKAFGSPLRWNARCPSCGSLERHRLFALSMGDMRFKGTVLHFAPEPAIAALLKRFDIQYISADLLRRDVDQNWNIEDIPCPGEQFDVIVCNHVLEHVNDRKALRELHRVLKPDGLLLVMVPIVEGCPETYEDVTVIDSADREVHFGQSDHIRVYGADFLRRLRQPGFDITVYTAFGADAVEYGLLMGEKLFLCRKSV
jgi:SAM-dependent methyltransferase